MHNLCFQRWHAHPNKNGLVQTNDKMHTKNYATEITQDTLDICDFDQSIKTVNKIGTEHFL